jgi:uncharacterized sulfatase
MPLAIRWGAMVPPNRVVTDITQFVDITATIYDATNTPKPTEFPLTGRSFLDTLTSDKQGRVDKSRKWIVSGRERHSSSRFGTLGYPQRVIRTDRYLYIRNFKPDLWPAGAPQKYIPERGGAKWETRADTSHNYPLEKMHGAYQDIDACPSLSFLVENRNDPYVSYYFHLAVDKRPAEELFDIQNDPGCLYNLADNPDYNHARQALSKQLEKELTRTGDPRMGPDGDIFETYKRVSSMRLFPPNIPSQRVAPK